MLATHRCHLGLILSVLAPLVGCDDPPDLSSGRADSDAATVRDGASGRADAAAAGGLDGSFDADPARDLGPGSNPAALLEAARLFPPMPQTIGELATLLGRPPTFSSGAPFNDLELTVFDTDYMDGENSGFDVFMPVDAAEPFPGRGEVKYLRPVLISDLDADYGGARGDRIILGTAELGPFFVRDPAGPDDDYVVIQQMDYRHGSIELAGNPQDYRLVYATAEDGVRTEGHYLFRVAAGSPDLIAFVFPCDALAPTISGRPPTDRNALCSDSRRLSLDAPDQFRFAEARSSELAAPTAFQFGSAGKEVASGVAVDAAGIRYLYGLSDGALGARDGPVENAVFVTSLDPAGVERWTTTIELPNGSMLKDAAVDDAHLYAVGRTLGALPGFENGGSWDGIVLKLRLSDGFIVATHQFGSPGIDGYGNVELDGDGYIYISAQGAPPRAGGPSGTDRDYLVAKHAAETLAPLWRVVEPPDDAVLASAEAWGGLTYVPASADAPARLVVAGWFFAATGADAFVSVYEDLDAPQPRRAAYRTIRAPGTSADWILDNTVDRHGNIYVAGFTTGALADGGGRVGSGDAYVMKLSPELDILMTRQLGTPEGDFVRKLAIGPSGDLFVVGSTFGDLYAENRDAGRRSGDVFVLRMSADLEPLASAQLGTPHEDRSGLAVGPTSVYLGGSTEGSFGAPSRGSFDAWTLELDPITLAPR